MSPSAPSPRRGRHRLLVALTTVALAAPTALLVATPAEARTGSKLTVQGPKQAQATRKITFKGKLRSGKKRRVVKVHVRQGKKWKQVRQLRTTKAGKFSVKLGTGKKTGKRVYRFTAPRNKRFKIARVRKTVQVTPWLSARDNSPLQMRWGRAGVPSKPKAKFNGAGTVRPAGDKATTYAGWNVALQRKHRDGWKHVSSASTAANGSFKVKGNANWLHSLKYRVQATNPSNGQVLRSSVRTLKAKPTWKPRGKRGAWRLMTAFDGTQNVRFRWDACGPPIRYRVNMQQSKGGQNLKDVRRAVNEVAQATGLKFKFQGRTKAHAWSGDNQGPKRPADADLLISWTRNKQARHAPFGKNSGTVGYGGLRGVTGFVDARGTVLKATHGHVAMRANWNRWNRKTAYTVLLHEIGHAVGLAHSPANNQLMYYTLGRNTPKKWGAGDLGGLNRQGFADGCIRPVNTPQAGARALIAPGDHDHDHEGVTVGLP